MGSDQHASGAAPVDHRAFWDALAQHHAAIEDNYLDRKTIRRIIHEMQSPVLVVGAGQGLLMEEIQKAGLECDGIDWSREMIRIAKTRRGIDILHADARAMPIPDQHYGTVIYATGVIDFTDDEEGIQAMLREGVRVVTPAGRIFIAFYRTSPVQELFVTRVGLLRNESLAFRETLGLYLLNPAQTIGWAAKRAGVSYFGGIMLFLRMAAFTTIQEKRTTVRMQNIVRGMPDPESFIRTAPETQPYRNEAAVRSLFERLGFPVKRLDTFPACFVAQIR